MSYSVKCIVESNESSQMVEQPSETKFILQTWTLSLGDLDTIRDEGQEVPTLIMTSMSTNVHISHKSRNTHVHKMDWSSRSEETGEEKVSRCTGARCSSR